MNLAITKFRAQDAIELVKTVANHDSVDFCGFDEWAKKNEDNPGYSIFLDDKIAAVTGVFPLYRHRGEVWAMIRHDVVENHPMTVARVAKDVIKEFRKAGFTRLEAPIPSTMPVNLRFAQWLGFKLEGIMRRAGTNGEDVYMTAVVMEGNDADR